MRFAVNSRILACSFAMALATVGLRADESKKPVRPSAEIGLADHSKMSLTLLDDALPVQTPHGKLLIPIADVRRIEFGYRLSAEVVRQINTAVADLAEQDTLKRDRAGERLLKIGPRAYPAVVRASKNPNRDLAINARHLLEKFSETYPEERLPKHDLDVIYTDDAKIAGRIEIAGIRVLTPQFGERTLKIADVVSVRVAGAEIESDVVSVEPGPQNLSNLGGQVGKVYHFKVTGTNTGSIYGTDIYTLDSQLSTAAVHAGVLKVGQTGVIKVTILSGQNAYQQSSRNGISSYGWGPYTGSYKISKAPK